jgi:hypothetical protein
VSDDQRLSAGILCVGLATLLDASWPSAGVVAMPGLLGFIGYGVSLTLFILVLRHLGTARTGAYYSSAPFTGAAVSIVLLSEPVTPAFLAGVVLMAIGFWIYLTECNQHVHAHESMEHDHMHMHDEHRQHDHPPGTLAEPHAHPHTHGSMVHRHTHYPDISSPPYPLITRV